LHGLVQQVQWFSFVQLVLFEWLVLLKYFHFQYHDRQQFVLIGLDDQRQFLLRLLHVAFQILEVGVAARLSGEAVTFRCRGEVILSTGAILTPKILQLSGIGPGEHLRAKGIPVLADSPDVGRRMRDHLGFLLPFRLKNDKGLNHRFQGIGLVKSVLQYYLLKSGPMATGPFEVGAFFRTAPQVSRPDAQLYLSAGRAGDAAGAARAALQAFCSWGNAWDKRVQWDAWIAWTRILLQSAEHGGWPERLDRLNNVALRD